MNILIWFRNDLRLHDHLPLQQALTQKTGIIPFYCFDPHHFGLSGFGFAKTGAFRAQFLLESLQDLANSLQEVGSDLIIRQGKPEEIIPQLVQDLNISQVYFNAEVTSEEIYVEQQIEKKLSQLGVKFKSFYSATLYHPTDLPFKISETPEVFTTFRQKLEKDFCTREPIDSPKRLPELPNIQRGNLPSLKELGLETPIFDTNAALKFKGGEKAGLARLKEYFWQKDCLKSYKETRNQMLGANYSSKFSPWLANGCLSPRLVYAEIQKYESTRVKNDSTYWLVFELLWRDYFRFIAAKHGKKIFYLSGLKNIKFPWLEDWERFDLWREGKTGYPLIDANMRELLKTGFMSNRGRQNVGSFLTKNLGINWQMGAEWFEYLLIDYDVCSNWGNWNYTAGVGNDARGFRYFNTTKQSKDYDPKGNYLRYWLPELESIPGDLIHEPWKLTKAEQIKYNCKIGSDYPVRVVDFFKSIEHNQKLYSNS